MTSIIPEAELLLILFIGGHEAKDLATEVNLDTGYMIMPLYRLN